MQAPADTATHYTLVVKFDGDPPSVAARMPVLGGTLEAVQFNDALEENRRLRDALGALARVAADSVELSDWPELRDALDAADDALANA